MLVRLGKCQLGRKFPSVVVLRVSELRDSRVTVFCQAIPHGLASLCQKELVCYVQLINDERDELHRELEDCSHLEMEWNYVKTAMKTMRI